MGLFKKSKVIENSRPVITFDLEKAKEEVIENATAYLTAVKGHINDIDIGLADWSLKKLPTTPYTEALRDQFHILHDITHTITIDETKILSKIRKYVNFIFRIYFLDCDDDIGELKLDIYTHFNSLVSDDYTHMNQVAAFYVDALLQNSNIMDATFPGCYKVFQLAEVGEVITSVKLVSYRIVKASTNWQLPNTSAGELLRQDLEKIKDIPAHKNFDAIEPVFMGLNDTSSEYNIPSKYVDPSEEPVIHLREDPNLSFEYVDIPYIYQN